MLSCLSLDSNLLDARAVLKRTPQKMKPRNFVIHRFGCELYFFFHQLNNLIPMFIPQRCEWAEVEGTCGDTCHCAPHCLGPALDSWVDVTTAGQHVERQC